MAAAGATSVSTGGATVNSTAMRDSGLVYESDAGAADAGPDAYVGPFGTLTPYVGDAGDDCANAVIWRDGMINVAIQQDNYVQFEGKLYQYVNERVLDYGRPECNPSNPTGPDCSNGQFWLDTGRTCSES